MLDIGWSELLVIAIVLIVVVGPKDLPPMLRAFGKMTSNLRKMAGEFRSQFDEALREADLDDVKNTLSDAQRLNPTNALRDAINPLRQMGQDIRSDLHKVTQMPSASQTDIEAQKAVEGAQPTSALPEVPPSVQPVSAAQPVTPVTAAPLDEPTKKPTRRAAAKVKSAESPDAPVVVAEKPKRTRAAAKPKTEAVSAPAETVAGKAPVRKRATKKTETPKDEA